MLPLLAVLGVALLTSQSVPAATAQSYLPATMVDGMEWAMFLNKFLDACDATGWYDKFLEPEWSGTVFAPVDLGFDALLQKANATWEEMLSPAMNATLSELVSLHIVPGPRAFPLTTVREGSPLRTAAPGRSLYVRRDVPGVTHVYAVERPEQDPLNFGTVLQYQEIRGGKAILYVIDRVLTPPAAKPAAGAAPAPTRRRERPAPAPGK